MPFKEPLRILILPEGISIPPPSGQSALVFDPGPPPAIKIYDTNSHRVGTWGADALRLGTDLDTPGAHTTFQANPPDISLYNTSDIAIARLKEASLTIGETVNPPVTGKRAVRLTPGVPQLALYTGDANETGPAYIKSITTPFTGMQIAGPDLSGIQSLTRLYVDTVNGFAGFQFDQADLYEFLSSSSVSLLTLDDTLAAGREADFFGGIFRVDQATSIGTGFLSDATAMGAKQDFDGTDQTGLTNTSFAKPATSVGFSFTAPPSGRGLCTWHARLSADVTADVDRGALASPRLGTGSTIGGGTQTAFDALITPPSDDLAIEARRDTGGGTNRHINQGGATYRISGLTPGSTYNLCLFTRCTSATSASYAIFSQAIGWIPLY